MPTVTLLQLRTRARERGDMQDTNFVTDSELTSYVNESARELYDLLVEANQDYYSTVQAFTIASGSSTYSLPSTVYKLRGVDIDLSGSWVPVDTYEQMERGRLQDAVISRLVSPVYYRPMGNTLDFLPAAQAPGSYRLRYVPFMTAMSGDSDTFDAFNGFEAYIVVDCAIKMKDKEESSVSVLMKQKEDLTKRIQAMANTRDYASAERVQDVRRRMDSASVIP